MIYIYIRMQIPRKTPLSMYSFTHSFHVSLTNVYFLILPFRRLTFGSRTVKTVCRASACCIALFGVLEVVVSQITG